MKRTLLYTILLSAVMLAGCSASDSPAASSAAASQSAQTEPAASYRTITPEDAKAMIGTEGVVLLDVRTQEEYDEAHIGGAALLPYDVIAQNADKLPQDKDTTIIVYCRTGRRSAIAAETLIGMGYTKVFDLGGIQSWPYETVKG